MQVSPLHVALWKLGLREMKQMLTIATVNNKLSFFSDPGVSCLLLDSETMAS